MTGSEWLALLALLYGLRYPETVPPLLRRVEVVGTVQVDRRGRWIGVEESVAVATVWRK